MNSTSFKLMVFIALYSISCVVHAESIIGQQSMGQQQQDEARQNMLKTESKNLLTSEGKRSGDDILFPSETPCYPLHDVILENQKYFPHWLTFNDLTKQVRGRCIGIQGVKLFSSVVQNRLITHGFITTRVLIPHQNLNEGILTLHFLPGTISEITFKEGSGRYIHTFNNFPEEKGSLLDLRGLEQGLENLQRIPGSMAKINLLPGKRPGETVVEVMRQQNKPWRFGVWADDSGSKYTGRYQGGMALYLDNPTSMNDMFYVAYGGGLKNEDGRRSDNVSGFYSIPWGYWLADLSASQYRYTQTIRSGDFSYLYSGDEKYLTAKMSRVVFRSASQKTTLGLKVIKRDSSYFLNDTEIDVQHRNTSSWKLQLDHLAYLPFGQVKASFGYQRAASWFGQQPDAEEAAGSADPEARIISASVDGSFPFTLAGITMGYEPHFMGQRSPDRLTQPDKFTIGNRWTVRGFDGENTLYADKGWYIRNDININFPALGMQSYLGLDYGEVSSSGVDYWNGKHIAGAVIGVRGVKGKLGYDLFAGTPVDKPDELHTSPVTLGFSLQWQY